MQKIVRIIVAIFVLLGLSQTVMVLQATALPSLSADAPSAASGSEGMIAENGGAYDRTDQMAHCIETCVAYGNGRAANGGYDCYIDCMTDCSLDEKENPCVN